MRLVQKRENGLLTQASVYMFVELNGPFCCRMRRSYCTRKTLFILASWSRWWCLAGCWCGTAEDSQSQLWLWRRPVSGAVGILLPCMLREWEPNGYRWGHFQPGHTLGFRPHVRSQKESARWGALVTFQAFFPQWASTLGSGNVIPAWWERGSIHRSSHFLPAPAEEEVDTLVLCSDKPETWEDHTRLQHFPPGQDVKYAWSPAQLNFYSSRLKQMTGSTDIFQVPFPQI